jgi:hypothetical protein
VEERRPPHLPQASDMRAKIEDNYVLHSSTTSETGMHDTVQPPHGKKQKVGGSTSKVDSAQDCAPLATTDQFQRAVEYVNGKLKQWVGNEITRVGLVGDRLHAILKDEQKENILLGRLVDKGSDLPMVQILLECRTKQYDMPNGEITLMDACRLAVYTPSGKMKKDAEIAQLAERKAEAQRQLSREMMEFSQNQNAFETLANPNLTDQAEVYKKFSTITLMRAFRHLCSNNPGGIVPRLPALKRTLAPPKQAKVLELDSEGREIPVPPMVLPTAELIGAELDLVDLVERVRHGEVQVAAVKTVLKHLRSGATFAVWLPKETLELMKDIPAYCEKIESTPLKLLPLEVTLDYVAPVERVHNPATKQMEMRAPAWDPLNFNWPDPEPMNVRIVGPPVVPMLKDQSVRPASFKCALPTVHASPQTARVRIVCRIRGYSFCINIRD